MLLENQQKKSDEENDKQIEIEDILKPNESGPSPTVVIDGPPGIGKTTLCRKLLNLWANGELKHQHYDLVLYCPLRDITQEMELENLINLNYEAEEVSMVTKWLERREQGKALLIIFDGWDELSTKLRQSSLPTKIICKQKLHNCSVIVTSRSYASSSLLKLTSVNKYVQVMGFLDQEEINTVIKEIISKSAQKLIDELQVRKDVYSMCHIPLFCSIVVNIFQCGNEQLPNTLTELYENFILQTIRRYVASTGTDADPEEINSLEENHLPHEIGETFKKMCELAFENLKEKNQKLTFSYEIRHLKKFGLTRNRDKNGYEFLHQSIQEFLAAWWIAKYNSEITEEFFNAHFDDDHFRMCLRFVAGLTKFEHEKYLQYFNKGFDLQCKKKPLFRFDHCCRKRFYKNPEITVDYNHHVSTIIDDVNFDAVLQLLYELQNKSLCDTVSQSINDHSLCLRRMKLSDFDILCLCYFLNNSTVTWNHLHLGIINEQTVQILTSNLSTRNQYKIHVHILEIYFKNVSIKTVIDLFQCFQDIQQLYIVLITKLPCPQDKLHQFLCHLLQLHQLKVLHFRFGICDLSTTEQYHYEEKHLEMNSTLEELVLTGHPLPINIIDALANNNSILSFTLGSRWTKAHVSIEHLLKNNHTLNALDIYNDPSSSLNIVEVNTPLRLNALEHLPHIKGLQYLKLYQCHEPHLIFDSYPNLQQLDISLVTAESVNKLFTILKSNTTLKTLRVKIENEDIYSSIGNSLRDMLTQNQTIQCLEIDPRHPPHLSSLISSTYLSYLTTGLSYNNSLQELSVYIPLSHTNNQQLQTYFDVISQKFNLTELKVYFTLDQSYYTQKEDLYYEQILPLFAGMLKSHKTIQLLKVKFSINSDLPINSKHHPSVQYLLQTIFLHPSLKYIGIPYTQLLQNSLREQKEILIDKQKLIPVVDMIRF